MTQTDQWEIRRMTYAEAHGRTNLAPTVQRVLQRLARQGVSERDFLAMSAPVQEAAWNLALDGLEDDGSDAQTVGRLTRRMPIEPEPLVAPPKRVPQPEAKSGMTLEGRPLDARPIGATRPIRDLSGTLDETSEDTVLELAPPARRSIDSCEHPQRLRRLYEGCLATGAINEAIEWLRAAANAGDAASQNELADIYMAGKLVPRDPAEAARWRRTAAQSLSSAIQPRPDIPKPADDRSSEGIPPELQRVWRLANDGCAASQAHLAGRFSRGEGVAQDWSRAAYWHERAARGGMAENQYRLGLMYLHGRGVERNIERAAEWFTRAKDNPSLSDAWATDSARLIRASAALELSQIMLRGDGIEQDVVLGVKFLEEAERAGSKVAGDELGRLYFHGKVVNKNAITAVHWFRRAAEGDDGYGPAKLHLAKCYLSGEGVKRNPSEASRWLKSAAEQPGRIGAEAMYLLGWLAEKGVGGTVDAPEALKWYYKSAVAGYAEALAKVKALCAELQAILPS